MADENPGRGKAEDAGKLAAGGWNIANFDALKNPPIALAASAYLIVALFALAVLVLVGFGLFASFPIAYETATGKFADRIEAAKVFFPILLALVGGPLLVWRVITAHIQAQATRHQAETGREAHYTSQFTKAVAHWAQHGTSSGLIAPPVRAERPMTSAQPKPTSKYA